MTVETLVLKVPSTLYARLKQSADESKRSVEDEAITVLSAAVANGELPQELRHAIAGLAALSDEQLWQAARDALAAQAATDLEALNVKRQREGLTKRESQRADKLLAKYDKVLLMRAHAAALLKQRGHDVAAPGG